jgi:hypothetical protein
MDSPIQNREVLLLEEAILVVLEVVHQCQTMFTRVVVQPVIVEVPQGHPQHLPLAALLQRPHRREKESQLQEQLESSVGLVRLQVLLRK